MKYIGILSYSALAAVFAISAFASFLYMFFAHIDTSGPTSHDFIIGGIGLTLSVFLSAISVIRAQNLNKKPNKKK